MLALELFGGDSYFCSDYQTMEEDFSKAVDSKRPCLVSVQVGQVWLLKEL